MEAPAAPADALLAAGPGTFTGDGFTVENTDESPRANWRERGGSTTALPMGRVPAPRAGTLCLVRSLAFHLMMIAPSRALPAARCALAPKARAYLA